MALSHSSLAAHPDACKKRALQDCHVESICRFINGLKAQGTAAKDARVLFYGAGSSAVGVAQMIATLISTEGKMSQEEARQVGTTLLTCTILCPAGKVTEQLVCSSKLIAVGRPDCREVVLVCVVLLNVADDAVEIFSVYTGAA